MSLRAALSRLLNRRRDNRRRDGLRVVGWGPFPMPGERRRMERAEREATEMTQIVAHLRRRHQDGDTR